MNGVENAKPKVLIIDDVRTNIMVLQTTLGDECEIWSATSGLKGLDLALTQVPDLILLDIMMPEMDGYEVCRILKADPRTKNIPVIFVTAMNETESEAKGLAIGAIDYITKPLNPAIVKARVKNHLKMKQLQDHLESLSLTDPLTGIANRRHFDLIFHREWEAALQNENQLAVILLDIDHFKLFNDTYGHLAGDRCLQIIGKVLKDSLPSGAFAARFGGEEFICLLPAANSDEAQKTAEKIRRQIEELQIRHQKSETCNVVTVSIGVAAMVPENELHPVCLLRMVDQALYRAKFNGRNQVVAAGGRIPRYQEVQYWRKTITDREPEEIDQLTVPVNL
jgi:diguanylate cyclase (GGDEF)-like protein